MFSGYHRTGGKAVQNGPEGHKPITFRNLQPGFLNRRTNKFAGLIEIFTRKVSRQMGAKLMGCLSELSWKTVGAVVKRPQCPRLNLLSAIAELENDTGEEFIKSRKRGEIGYETDLGNFPDVFTGEAKQRVYGEQRSFLVNYKTVIGKEEALQKVIGEDSEEGLVS